MDYGPYFQAVGLPVTTLPLGALDYAVMRGVTSGFVSRLYPHAGGFVPGYRRVRGDGGVREVMTGQTLTQGKLRLTDITDGTTNTIMVVEDAGRHQIYAKGKPIAPNGPEQVQAGL